MTVVVDHGLGSDFLDVLRAASGLRIPIPHATFGSEMTLLQQMNQRRLEARERRRHEVRTLLREVLDQTLPGRRVFLFGSLTEPGKFSEESDIDVAIESEPDGISLYQLVALLSERMGRRVDVIQLHECRFKDKILKVGELWTPKG